MKFVVVPAQSNHSYPKRSFDAAHSAMRQFALAGLEYSIENLADAASRLRHRRLDNIGDKEPCYPVANHTLFAAAGRMARLKDVIWHPSERMNFYISPEANDETRIAFLSDRIANLTIGIGIAAAAFTMGTQWGKHFHGGVNSRVKFFHAQLEGAQEADWQMLFDMLALDSAKGKLAADIKEDDEGLSFQLAVDVNVVKMLAGMEDGADVGKIANAILQHKSTQNRFDLTDYNALMIRRKSR